MRPPRALQERQAAGLVQRKFVNPAPLMKTPEGG
jgi:hypothetical protein